MRFSIRSWRHLPIPPQRTNAFTLIRDYGMLMRSLTRISGGRPQKARNNDQLPATFKSGREDQPDKKIRTRRTKGGALHLQWNVFGTSNIQEPFSIGKSPRLRKGEGGMDGKFILGNGQYGARVSGWVTGADRLRGKSNKKK